MAKNNRNRRRRRKGRTGEVVDGDATDRREGRAKRSAASFALVPSLPVLFAPLRFPSSPPEGRGRGRGRGGQDGRPSRRCPGAGRSAARWWRGVAMTSSRSGRGGRPSLSLSADTSGRWGERLAMVWTVKTSDGAEGEARNGRRGRRNTSPLFPLFLFRLLVCSALPSPPEGRE